MHVVSAKPSYGEGGLILTSTSAVHEALLAFIAGRMAANQQTSGQPVTGLDQLYLRSLSRLLDQLSAVAIDAPQRHSFGHSNLSALAGVSIEVRAFPTNAGEVYMLSIETATTDPDANDPYTGLTATTGAPRALLFSQVTVSLEPADRGFMVFMGTVSRWLKAVGLQGFDDPALMAKGITDQAINGCDPEWPFATGREDNPLVGTVGLVPGSVAAAFSSSGQPVWQCEGSIITGPLPDSPPAAGVQTPQLFIRLMPVWHVAAGPFGYPPALTYQDTLLLRSGAEALAAHLQP